MPTLDPPRAGLFLPQTQMRIILIWARRLHYHWN